MTNSETVDTSGQEPEKRRQILAGAREVFMARGYDGASMDAIAKTAGVSKGTLYVYFQDKEALFEALVLQARWELAESITAFEEQARGDVRDLFRRIARVYADKLVAPDHLSMIRMVIGAVEKFPSVGGLFYTHGPARGIARMAEVMEREMAAGHLRRADPVTAAMHFIDLCGSGLFRRMIFNVVTDVSPEALDRTAAEAADVFLRAYGANPPMPETP